MIIIENATIEVATPHPIPPSSGNPNHPYTNIKSSGILSNIPEKAIMNIGFVSVIPSL